VEVWRVKSYAAGDRARCDGRNAPGAFVILAGRVDVTARNADTELIVTHGRALLGQQLSGPPISVDAYATEAVETYSAQAARSVGGRGRTRRTHHAP
jgi:hypothetical protein